MSEPLDMMPFQPAMIDWMIERERCAVFAGMGMTKSVCTLMAFSEMLLQGEVKGMFLTAPHRVLSISSMVKGVLGFGLIIRGSPVF